jgi:4-hydroxy-tetrahydrodipicolinate synthase
VLAELCAAVDNGDLASARELHESLLELNQAVFYDTNPIPVKYMMKRLGMLSENSHRLPNAPATPEVAQRLDGVLERAGLLSRGATHETR